MENIIFFNVMKSTFKDIFKILKKNFFSKLNFYYFLKNIFENNVSIFKREQPAKKKHYILPVGNITCLNLC